VDQFTEFGLDEMPDESPFTFILQLENLGYKFKRKGAFTMKGTKANLCEST
jgi:hypothetical protein